MFTPYYPAIQQKRSSQLLPFNYMQHKIHTHTHTHIGRKYEIQTNESTNSNEYKQIQTLTGNQQNADDG